MNEHIKTECQAQNLTDTLIAIMIRKELITSSKINKRILEKGLSQRKVAKLIDYDDATFNAMILGKQSFPEHIVKKLLLILEVSRKDFDSWIIADNYSKEIIELALKAKQETKVKRNQLILTLKIDYILKDKDLSRTALAKQIVYSQSSINAMIVGKRNISKSVLEKMANALEISQINILAWTLADKYNLQTLEIANLITT